MLFLLLSVVLASPEVSVSVPDSVQTGAVFMCEIALRGSNLGSVECAPVFSPGLQYIGSTSSHSFSSVTTPSGTSISSEINLLLSFRASYAGAHFIGPLILRTSATGETLEIPLILVTAGNAPPRRETTDPIQNTRENEIAWMEIEIDTAGRVYPGQTFSVDYYIYKTRRNAEIVDLFLEPSNYASSKLLENFEELQWIRCKNGDYRTWLATLEVTPAFACTLSLPVLRGRIGIPGGMMRPFEDCYISSEGEKIPVYPFPQADKPSNFNGITAPISFRIERVTQGYSAAGERCIQLSVFGPGYSQLREPPELTIMGPAELLPGRSFAPAHDTNAWFILVEPSDSGMVVIGPDSVAWFDTDLEEYRQSIIPACTLYVYPITSRPVDISSLQSNDSGTSLIWIVTVSLLLILVIIILLHYRNKFAGYAPKISEVNDVEELLTAMGYRLSELLTGSRSYMGSQELDDALDEKAIDALTSRGLLRHWKDLELLLSERTAKPEQLERLKRKSLELIRNLESELKK
ncbi:MAG: hypothetical protein KAR44_01085 [Candidatus Aegiribacteria sp.]|nr:hypothetical protein [Candidatus Aegiribacteria sp.]